MFKKGSKNEHVDDTTLPPHSFKICIYFKALVIFVNIFEKFKTFPNTLKKTSVNKKPYGNFQKEKYLHTYIKNTLISQ